MNGFLYFFWLAKNAAGFSGEQWLQRKQRKAESSFGAFSLFAPCVIHMVCSANFPDCDFPAVSALSVLTGCLFFLIYCALRLAFVAGFH